MTDHTDLATLPDAHLNPVQRERSVAIVRDAPPQQQATKLMPNEQAGFLMLSSENWSALRQQCTELVEDRALHSSIDTAGKAMVIGMKAIEMGIPLTAAWSGMRIIDGEVTVLGKLALRMIQQRVLAAGGVCQPLPVAKGQDAKEAGWRMARPGEEPRDYWFTWEDAERAELTMIRKRDGGSFPAPSYKKYPDRMLSWRAFAKGAAVTFADILQGCLLAEEMEHKDPAFILTQEREHDALRPAPSSGGRSFHDSAPPRAELGKGHPEVRAVCELVEAYLERHTKLHAHEAPAQDAEDGATEAWYKQVRREKWHELTKQCVRREGSAPTLDEAKMMQTILNGNLRVMDEELQNRALTAAHDAQKAADPDEERQADQPGGGSPPAGTT